MSQNVPVDASLPERAYDLVVIGASAGGIEALATLVASLPADFAAPLVIAQHLDPDHVSHLGEILARRTTLEVRTVIEQEPLLPGVIYVVPADRDVEITDHIVRVRRNTGHRPKPSVNRLFSSAAHAHGERLIGVILTGAGSDGADGARDVKAAGGMVIIENPATAAYASMPQSLAPSTVDLRVDLVNIGPLLAHLIDGTHEHASDDAENMLPTLLAQLREQSGIDFSTYKPPTILRRLQRRLVATETPTLAAYLRYLNTHPDEYQLLLASFLIKVTEFFRDPELFGILRDEVLPTIVEQARAQGGQVRCWSAGCATGEEAYSLAIMLAEVLGDGYEDFPVRIFATDVDVDAITFARRGVYPASALARMSDELVARYFTPLDGAFEVIPALRSLVIFGQHDLGQRAPFPHIDLVLCRNVLIYFTPELQRRTLQLFAFALRDNGYLALGKAETPSVLAAYFAPVHPTLKLYQRQGERVMVPPTSAPHRLISLIPAASRLQVAKAVGEPPTIGLRTNSAKVGALVLGLPLGIVVVDPHYDIQAINAIAQRLLGIFRTAIGEDLIHAITNVPSTPVRAIIDAALNATDTPTEVTLATLVGDQRHLQFAAFGNRVNGAVESVLLWITDVTVRVQAQQLAEEQARQAQARGNTPGQPAAPLRANTGRQQQAWLTERQQWQAERTQLLAQIEQVAAINSTLVAANQELVQANLGLVSANEEVLIRNEELQASTEEIKTLNEELQATNEELETLNEEMEATVEELRTTNDDLVARTSEVQQLAALREEQRQASAAKAVELAVILRSMGDALIVLNQAGAVLFTNEAYVRLFGDAGVAIVAQDEYGQPLPSTAQPRQQAANGIPFRMTFTQPNDDEGRRWVEATGEPIRVGDDVQGGVITFRDITDRSLRRLQDEFLALASHELRSPLTNIKLAAQMLQHSAAMNDPRTLELLQSIVRQVQRLQRLIDDLTDVSRLQFGHFRLEVREIDLREVARQAVAAITFMTPTPPIVLEAETPVLMQADAVRLEQILVNLLTNAMKYASTSERIMVRVRSQGDAAEIEVQDTGPGIPAAALPHLFQRFYQVAPHDAAARNGLGLGLFITRELVLAHGGTIQVASVVGQGTTFTLRFPLLPPTAMPDQA